MNSCIYGSSLCHSPGYGSSLYGLAPDQVNWTERNGKIYAPLVPLIESLGGYVTWEARSQTTYIDLNGPVATIQNERLMSGYKTLDSPAIMGADGWMVPVEFFEKMVGARVLFDGDAVTVSLH